MRNDGWNAMWDVWCGLECVLWDSHVMCNLYLNVVTCMWNVGVMWNGVLRCGGAIWCELYGVKCGVMCMWNVVRCGMRSKCKMCDVEYGVLWTVVSRYVEGYRMQDEFLWCEMWWCGIVMKEVAYSMWCVIVVWYQMWKMMHRVVMSDVVVWCKTIKMWWCNVMWNMVWCEMCCDVERGCGVEWCEMWTMSVWCEICCALRCGGVKWWWETDCGVMWCQM